VFVGCVLALPYLTAGKTANVDSCKEAPIIHIALPGVGKNQFSLRLVPSVMSLLTRVELALEMGTRALLVPIIGVMSCPKDLMSVFDLPLSLAVALSGVLSVGDMILSSRETWRIATSRLFRPRSASWRQ